MPTNDNTVSNVTTGKPKVGGAVYRAPLGTSLPTDTTTQLNEAFKCVGYVSEDGMTNSLSRSSEPIKAWGQDIVMHAQSDYEETWKGMFIEALNSELLKMTYGDSNVSGTLATGLTVQKNAKELDEASYVIEMAIRGGGVKRVVIPDGKVTEVGDISYKDNEVVGYDLTIGCMADSSGNTSYEYVKSA